MKKACLLHTCYMYITSNTMHEISCMLHAWKFFFNSTWYMHVTCKIYVTCMDLGRFYTCFMIVTSVESCMLHAFFKFACNMHVCINMHD